MTSVIYASLSAVIITWLSLNVIKKRRHYKISVGDGGNKSLQTAMAAHTNAIEYIPISLLLLFALEHNNANLIIVHLLGLFLIIGRIIHAKGMLTEALKTRVTGMQITINTIIGLTIVNLFYLPYEKFFQL